MDGIEIRKVDSLKALKNFVNFPFGLYKGNPYWVPPLKFDEMNTLRKDRNPAFEYCEAEYWMAYQDNNPVGRIAGMINHHEAGENGKKLVRFGWIDFVDNPEVSLALIKTVEEWGKSKGMNGIHGPLGFNDMDPEGMMIEGFDEISSLAVIYNYAYYPNHMEMLGFRKAADSVQFEVTVPSEIPEKVERLTEIVLEKYKLRLLRPRSIKEIKAYAGKLFDMYNDTFRVLYGFTPLSKKQVEYYTKMYLGFLRPKFVSMVIDEHDDVVGFGVTMPSLSLALQKANGSLMPFGFLHILRAMWKNDIVHMYLVGVRPDYQGKGILALVYHELNKAYMKAGIKLTRTNPQLDDNLRAISIWKNYDSRINIRRRLWIKEI